jgi:sugar phosphate isomerase/epimerase
MGVKGRCPFRVGATSYVLPADMVTNVRRLAGTVDDIELLVFESDAMAELPDDRTLGELGRIAGAESLTYTVHLPLDISFGHPDAAERERSIEKCVRTVERMSVLNPFAWILHCDRQSAEVKALHDAVWVENTAQSLSRLLACGIDPKSVCVETLDGNSALLEPVIRESGVSVCLDIGHLLLYGLDLDNHLATCGDKARVMHWHGVIDGKDHQAISGMHAGWLERIIAAAAQNGSGRVVTIEVFNQEDLDASLRIMEELITCLV